MNRISNYINKFIYHNNIEKLLLFWLVLSLFIGFISVNSMGVKYILGIYQPKEIDMENVLIKIAGRTYDKSMIIQNGNMAYEASCIDDYNLICEKFFQKSIPVNNLKFIQMVDNKGYIIYSKFSYPSTDKEVIIDNQKDRMALESKYIRKAKYDRFIIMVPVIMTIFFSVLWFLKQSKSSNHRLD